MTCSPDSTREEHKQDRNRLKWQPTTTVSSCNQEGASEWVGEHTNLDDISKMTSTISTDIVVTNIEIGQGVVDLSRANGINHRTIRRSFKQCSGQARNTEEQEQHPQHTLQSTNQPINTPSRIQPAIEHHQLPDC